MYFHFYLTSFSHHFAEGFSFESLVSVVCEQVGKSKEELVLCDERNAKLADDSVSSLTDDSHVLVYEIGRVLMDGLNKEGRCTNENCSFFNKIVVDNCGFIESERIFFGCCGTCPFCGKLFEVLGLYLKNCHFNMFIIRDDCDPKETDDIDASNLEPHYFDLMLLSQDERYDFNVKRVGDYVCRVCHNSISEDCDCDRVRRKSICEDCSKIQNCTVCSTFCSPSFAFL